MRVSRNVLKKIIIIFIIFISGGFFLSCDKQHSGDFVLFDFENDSELDRLNWKCHSLFSLSDKYSSKGSKSLRVELYTSTYPGVSFRKYKKNWDGYKKICFDVYNPVEEKIKLTVRIDDSPEDVSYADRYNHKVILSPGENRIILPFSALITSGTKRKIDFKNIFRFTMFVVKPKKKIHIYIDSIRLAN